MGDGFCWLLKMGVVGLMSLKEGYIVLASFVNGKELSPHPSLTLNFLPLAPLPKDFFLRRIATMQSAVQ